MLNFNKLKSKIFNGQKEVLHLDDISNLQDIPLTVFTKAFDKPLCRLGLGTSWKGFFQ